MENKYNLEFSKSFERDIKKFKKDSRIVNRIKDVLEKLANNPFDKSLKTHQVNVPSLGKLWSSRVSADLRIVWEFGAGAELVILLLRLGGHDTVYS